MVLPTDKNIKDTGTISIVYYGVYYLSTVVQMRI